MMRGKGYGAYLYAIYLQSLSAPGKDGELVKNSLEDFLRESKEEQARMNQFFAEEPGEDEE